MSRECIHIIPTTHPLLVVFYHRENRENPWDGTHYVRCIWGLFLRDVSGAPIPRGPLHFPYDSKQPKSADLPVEVPRACVVQPETACQMANRPYILVYQPTFWTYLCHLFWPKKVDKIRLCLEFPEEKKMNKSSTTSRFCCRWLYPNNPCDWYIYLHENH